MKIYIDGKFYDEKSAKVSVFDHGLLYGDGVFEGIRAYHGRVFKLKEHIDRLFYSAKALLLTIPMSHAEVMAATVETCRRNKIRDGYIRLLVTRGVGTLGLNPNRCKRPSVIIIADKIQLYPQEYYERVRSAHPAHRLRSGASVRTPSSNLRGKKRWPVNRSPSSRVSTTGRSGRGLDPSAASENGRLAHAWQRNSEHRRHASTGAFVGRFPRICRCHGRGRPAFKV